MIENLCTLAWGGGLMDMGANENFTPNVFPFEQIFGRNSITYTKISGVAPSPHLANLVPPKANV